MAIHDFVCEKCKVIVEDTNTKIVHKCPMCDGDMVWDLHVAIHGNYKRPIVSQSLAINPNQIAEHKRLFPNIRVTPDGCPVFDNYTRHEKYLKATGFKKHTQRIKAKTS